MSDNQPNSEGFFGRHGGSFVAEPLQHAVLELQAAYKEVENDENFFKEIDAILKNYVGRPSPIYFAQRLSKEYSCNIYLKREDLNHTGAHKINNAIGQVELARKLGKTRIIAETGAGQHGVATATACARVNLPCVIYMGETDIKRQAPNIERMKLLGAEVVPVTNGSKTLKDALNEALRDWVANVTDTFYVIGTVAGPHPYPQMVRDFNSVIGREAKEQMMQVAKQQPDAIVACVGGGSNAMGIFYPYLDEDNVKLFGVEAGGTNLNNNEHAAPLTTNANEGILHGMRSYVMQDEFGQIVETSSISAGLDYPSVGPEHSYLKDINCAKYVAVNDDEVLAAFNDLSSLEGILPALESAHAIAYCKKIKDEVGANATVLVCLSGRGDKDLATVMKHQVQD